MTEVKAVPQPESAAVARNFRNMHSALVQSGLSHTEAESAITAGFARYYAGCVSESALKPEAHVARIVNAVSDALRARTSASSTPGVHPFYRARRFFGNPGSGGTSGDAV